MTFFMAGYALLQVIGDGETWLIFSPSLRQSQHVMEYIYKWMGYYENRISDLKQNMKYQTQSSIHFSNGGSIYALPATGSTVRGIPASGVIWDEGAHFLHGTDIELWEAVIPALSASKRKRVAVVSTPYGDGNLYYEMYHNRERFPEFNPVFYHYSERPDMDIASIRASMDSLSFQQEYEGMIVSDVSSYFPLSLLKECEDQELSYKTPGELKEMNIPMYAFVDVGKRMDFTAVMVFALLNGKLQAVYKKVLKTPEEKEWKNQYAELRTLLATGRINRMLIDRAGIGDQITDTLMKECPQVMGFNFTNDNKNEMFPLFKKKLENKELIFPPDLDLFSSLHLIERIQRGNIVTYDSEKRTDSTGHSDLGIAAIGAVYCFEREAGVSTSIRALSTPRTGSLHNSVIRGLSRHSSIRRR